MQVNPPPGEGFVGLRSHDPRPAARGEAGLVLSGRRRGGAAATGDQGPGGGGWVGGVSRRPLLYQWSPVRCQVAHLRVAWSDSGHSPAFVASAA